MSDMLGRLDTWLQTHDTTIDLVTVWMIAIAGLALALVHLLSWWALRETSDETALGGMLKRQKASESLAWASVAALYGLTLFAYYTAHRFGFYDRLALRIVLFGASLAAAVIGVRFVVVLGRELRTERRGPAPLMTDGDGGEA